MNNNEKKHNPNNISRRKFLYQLAGTGAGTLVLSQELAAALNFLQPVNIQNPLNNYPNRDWEKVYRNLYQSDDSFTLLCAPNDTHNCLLRAYVKNGVVTRLSPTYGYNKATDLEGNQASQRWDPRCCQKGLALVRRFYGDRRCKQPMIRQGYLKWIKDGFPRQSNNGAIAEKYLNRGKDAWITISWDEAFAYSARVLINIAQTYTGTEGKNKLLSQGYHPAMVDATGEAGTQVLKFRGGMPALGMTRIFAQYRLANTMALLDHHLRKIEPKDAKGGRGWDNYSWHTDLFPRAIPWSPVSKP